MKVCVSVVVPVYNASKYVETCITSILNQSLKEVEIILVEDASEDNSLAILQSYQKQYPDQIKLLINSKNMGQGYSRNRGLKEAIGEYISFVDSDDYLHPNMYEDMIKGAREYNYPEVILTNILFVKDDAYFQQDLTFLNRTNGKFYETVRNLEQILDASPSSCNKLFRRDFIQNKTFLEHRMWEDVAFTYSQLFCSHHLLIYSNLDYFYRKSSTTGVSAQGFTPNPHLLDCLAIADEIERATREANCYETFQTEIKHVQIITCLQRVSEVLHWNISGDSQFVICRALLQLIEQKYGDWKFVDQEELSYKLGFWEFGIIEKMADANMDISLKDNLLEVIQQEIEKYLPVRQEIRTLKK